MVAYESKVNYCMPVQERMGAYIFDFNWLCAVWKLVFRRHFRYVWNNEVNCATEYFCWKWAKAALLYCLSCVRELERCGYAEAVLVVLCTIHFGFVAIQDELGRLAGCAVTVVRTKFHVETVGQLFALIQTGTKFPYFGACASPFEWSLLWFCCVNPHGDLLTELGTSLHQDFDGFLRLLVG